MMINNPQTWNTLLEKAPPGAVLMGGAVRDYLLNQEAKDYDIFHTYQYGIPEIPGWKYIPREVVAGEVHPDYDIVVDGQPNPIGSVYDYDVLIKNDGEILPKKIRVQLVGVHYADPTEHFKHFDHTLTLALYGSKGMIVDRRLFNSIHNKVVTCTNKAKPLKSLNRAISVINRIDPKKADAWIYQGF